MYQLMNGLPSPLDHNSSWLRTAAMLIAVILTAAPVLTLLPPASAYSYHLKFNLSNNQGFSTQEQFVSTDNGTVYVAWQDDSNGQQNIFFSFSSDYGNTSSDPVDISPVQDAVSVSQIAD